jgi:hypothetical protein
VEPGLRAAGSAQQSTPNNLPSGAINGVPAQEQQIKRGRAALPLDARITMWRVDALGRTYTNLLAACSGRESDELLRELRRLLWPSVHTRMAPALVQNALPHTPNHLQKTRPFPP